MFCPDCRSILHPKKYKGKRTLACPSCGYVAKDPITTKITETVKEKKLLNLVDKNLEDEVLPKCEAKCEKCENKTAFYWLVQTRAGDEAETKFLKCTKCGHTWREYN